jgi:Uma2 family endonuclease
MSVFENIQSNVLKIEMPRSVMNDEEFYEFCTLNKDWQVERSKDGQILIMPPTLIETSFKNNELARQLGNWNFEKKLGFVSESNGGYILPDTSMKAPDAAWISHERFESRYNTDKKTFPYVCPEFIVELMSDSDSLKSSTLRMEAWMENGCLMAWLINPKTEKVYVYRTEGLVHIIEGFDKTVSGEDILPDFELVLKHLK